MENKFSTMLKKLRTEKGITQSELADALDTSRSSIGMYENGEREPSFEFLERASSFFNVSVAYLLMGTNSENIPDMVQISDDVYISKNANPRIIESIKNSFENSNEGNKTYYTDDNVNEIAQLIYNKPQYAALFNTVKKVKPEDVELIRRMIEKMTKE